VISDEKHVEKEMNRFIPDQFATRLRELGPYFLLEVLLPGGTLLALLLWWHRHRHDGGLRRVLCRNR
jgi:hypothetical protein